MKQEYFSAKEFSKFIVEASKIMEKNKQLLFELDSRFGDGDLGITMTKGFSLAHKHCQSHSELEDLDKLIISTGMVFAREASSTMGTLLASGFIEAGKKINGNNFLDCCGMALFSENFASGIMSRGKANVGDRTLVDSVYPAALAFREAANNGLSISKSTLMAYKAALDGVEKTKEMPGIFGRAAYFNKKVLGTPDQGALVGALIYEALCKTVQDE